MEYLKETLKNKLKKEESFLRSFKKFPLPAENLDLILSLRIIWLTSEIWRMDWKSAYVVIDFSGKVVVCVTQCSQTAHLLSW